MHWNLGMCCPLTGLWCSYLTRVQKHFVTLTTMLQHLGRPSAANAGTEGAGWWWWDCCKPPCSSILMPLENNHPPYPCLDVGLRWHKTGRKLLWCSWKGGTSECNSICEKKGQRIKNSSWLRLQKVRLHITFSGLAGAKRRRNWRWKKACSWCSPAYLWRTHHQERRKGCTEASAVFHARVQRLRIFSFLLLIFPDFLIFFHLIFLHPFTRTS